MNDRALNFLFGFLKLAGLMFVVSSIPALAQFEVAPDHFDSTPAIEKKQATKQRTVKSGLQNSGSRVSTSGRKHSRAATPVAVADNRNHAAGGSTTRGKHAQKRDTSTVQSSTNRKKQTGEDNVAVASRR